MRSGGKTHGGVLQKSREWLFVFVATGPPAAESKTKWAKRPREKKPKKEKIKKINQRNNEGF